MTVRAHADAVLALLAAAPGNPLRVLDGAVPKETAPPYVLVYFGDEDPELPDSRALEGSSERFVLRAWVHCVGGNAAAARALGERVRAALLDVVPSIAGRSCWPIRREEGSPPQRDESTGTLVMDRVDVYRLESVPA
ncbi:tail completion protein gp17 [Micromonospora sp. WMMD754]|uniref:tail completion protein gp17 n=1 Tax=Micromonospora sp. WMMD754 TaxID=3404114 RepID=UPI003BF52BA5